MHQTTVQYPRMSIRVHFPFARAWSPLLLLLLLLPACARSRQNQGEFAGTFPTKAAVQQIISATPLEVSFAELNEAPQLYQDQLIRVRGTFTRLPLPTCAPNHGPRTTWALIADELRLDAAGLEGILPLIPRNAQLTVDGIWRLYSGPLGCGKEPNAGNAWYLQAQWIVSPNPLTDADQIADVAPQPGGGDFLGPPDVLPTATLTTTPTLTTPILPLLSTPTPSATPPLLTPTPTNTPPPSLTATPTLTPNPLATDTPTPTPGPSLTPSITPTPTITSTPTPVTTTPNVFATATLGTPPPTFTPGGYPAPSPGPYP